MSFKFKIDQPHKLFIVIITVLGFLIFNNAHAQSSSDILVDVIPANPNPGESVTINLNSYSLDINSSNINWLVNGKSVLSGIGKKTYTLTAGTAGSETSVTIKVADLETKIIIKPSVMVMLWQADDSYVPPFYKGKALPARDSTVKIVAMPEIKVGNTYLNPKNMTYSWSKDFTNDEGASGYGKNSFNYISDYLDASNYIEVNATTPDQKYSSTSNTTVGTFAPKIIFYRNEESMGTRFETAITDGHNIIDKEILFAAPFFISPKDLRNPRLVWTWSINGRSIFSQDLHNNLLPLQVQSGVSGTSTVKLDIENMDKIFQTASSEINVQF